MDYALADPGLLCVWAGTATRLRQRLRRRWEMAAIVLLGLGGIVAALLT